MLMYAKSLSMCDFLLHAAMRRVILAGMRLARIHKKEGNTFISKNLCHRFQRWRRQRAVRSGVRAKLHQHIPFAPVIAQPYLLAGFQQNRAEIRSRRADTRTGGEAIEVALALEDG